MRFRRLTTVLAATVAVWMMLAGTAFAHFCYVANRSDQGNASAANSKGWISIEEILVAEFGLCEAGVDYFDSNYLAPRGLSTGTLLHEKALLAGPHAFSDKASDGKGIDHLFASEADLEDLDATIEGAFAACG